MEGVCEGRSRSEQGSRATPRLPAGGLSLVPPSCQSRTYLGMSTLRDLIFKRPSRQFQYLHVLLDLSSHEKDKVTLHRPAGLPAALPVLGTQPGSCHVPLGGALLAAVFGRRLFFHM